MSSTKSLWQFISILAITLLTLTIYSFSPKEIDVYGVSIKKTSIKDFLFTVDTLDVLGFNNLQHLSDTTDKEEIVTDTSSQKILLIGDSMLEGLMLRLRDYTAFNGHEMKSVIWYSSSSLWYGTSDTLSHFIKQYKPTYVMLVLGANELFVGNIKTKRAKYVKRIIAQIDTIPYIWVGPPNWKDDTGINDLIIDAAGKYQYFPSKDLSYKRYKDGAHPTHASAVLWMDSIAKFITTKSNYRIKLDFPDKRYKISPNATLLQPKK